jgi:hypothetical protein
MDQQRSTFMDDSNKIRTNIPNPDQNPTKEKGPVKEPGEKDAIILQGQESQQESEQKNDSTLSHIPANVGGEGSIGIPPPSQQPHQEQGSEKKVEKKPTAA